MSGEEDARIGLCARCRHARTVTSRTTAYWLCERSKTDPRFVKYPRLPVIECPGFEKGEPRASAPGPAAPGRTA